MKRAETIAWSALVGLLVIMGILIAGGAVYGFTVFWAGAMLAGGQALVVGLAAWGLMLARQARELGEEPGAATDLRTGTSKERMLWPSSDKEAFSKPLGDVHKNDTGARTLDTGFQRLLVAGSGGIMTGLGAWAAWLVYGAYRWSVQNPGQPLSVAGPYEIPEGGKPQWLDERALLIGLAAAFLYGVLYWVSRPRRDEEGFGEATRSTCTLGITGMAALAAATLLGYFRFSWASEIATGVVAFFLVLQGLELIVNSLRSYSSIEEMDQEAVDLQASPLGPMLESIWLAGLRMLFTQSVGLSRGDKKERGVVARLMPRVLAAIAVIAIVASCFRVVEPGTVAVLERLGFAKTDGEGRLQEGALLQPGLHVTYPWPIDEMVVIPTGQLQTTNVGTELHSLKEWKGIDFQFWKFTEASNDVEDLFRTGDPGGGQVLETYVQVLWRVAHPEKFYWAISHSEFVDKRTAKTVPIYEAIVQQSTSFAVTRTFAIHSLDQIMIGDRREVETHCKSILQQKLDGMDSGITVDYLTIKDLHPPFGHADKYDPNEPRIGGLINITPTAVTIEADPQNQSTISRGPASAFEFVISMREFRETIIDMTRASVTKSLKEAEAFAATEKSKAEAYKLDKVARAHGDADRLLKMTEGLDPKTQQYKLDLMKQQLLYATLKDLLDPVNKIIVDPAVKDVDIYQATDKGLVPMPTGR